MNQSDKEIANQKSKLRDFYRKERKFRFISDSWLHILSAAEFSEVKGRNIASYISYGVEPSTLEINKQLLASGANLFLPRLLKSKDLEWVPWFGQDNKLKKTGNFFEPIGEAVGITFDVKSIFIFPPFRVTLFVSHVILLYPGAFSTCKNPFTLLILVVAL